MKKSIIQHQNLRKITITFGYTLFGLWLLALMLYTVIPMTAMIFNPVVRHLNATIMLISLTAGAVLPPLVSYILGDRATRSKDTNVHHFDGVLFGIASYWIALFFNFIGSDTISGIRNITPEPWATLVASWPILATLGVMSIAAVSYSRVNQNRRSVLEHRPYQLTLLGGMAASFCYLIYNQTRADGGSWSITVLSIIIPVALAVISYTALLSKGSLSVSARLCVAVLSVSIGSIAASAIGMLTSYANTNLSTIVPVAFGIATWLFYLLVIRRKV